jgi:hypothetical protein
MWAATGCVFRIGSTLPRRRRAWVDESVPALDGKTPWQAAAEPALRPKLVALVKEGIRRADRNGLARGKFEDEGWIAVELGLTELQLPMPPRLAELAGAAGGDRPVEEDIGDDGEDPSESDAVASFLDEVGGMAGNDEGMDRMREALQDECPELDEWLEDVSDDLNDEEWYQIATTVTLAWFLFKARYNRTLHLDVERLHRELQLLIEKTAASSNDPNAMLDALRPERHEALFIALTMTWFESGKSGRPSIPSGLSQGALLLGLLVLRAVIDELDRAKSGL